ncbi:sensor histidine kinase [Propioniciclava soli]|uniref:Histidine kinase/HSP90-like ATPase domain-containing protein n=1 Tax=Propioniciclava soli TaxID=2775081 RepID=A0ABZ3CB61_9ACTN|nr:sensor histidine kinase [Propioniciclava soli]
MSMLATPEAPSSPPVPTTSRVVMTGYRAWIDRAVALCALGTGLAALVLATTTQLAYINTVWLVVIGGGIFASSILLPIYAWSSRGVRVPATVFALSVMVGLWTWTSSWRDPSVTALDAPFLWMVIGVSTVVISIAWGDTVAVVHNLFCSAAYLIARVSNSGGAVSALVALQDTLIVALQPLGLLLLFSFARKQAADLDAWVAASNRLVADAALRTALVGERARLDGVIHDEVMTTLVSAGRGDGTHDASLAAQARHALASLDAEGSEDIGADAFPPANVGRLLEDVVGSACPTATLGLDIDPMAPLVPHKVVRTLARAVREATINAEKHAQAARVRVDVRISAGRQGRVDVAVLIADDGRGFDPALVSSRRLGIRVSLVSRMESVGGTARVESVPGDGTRVALEWSGHPDERRRTSRAVAGRDHPMFERIDVRPIGRLTVGFIVLFVSVGVLEIFASAVPVATALTVGLVALSTLLVISGFGRRQPAWRAWGATGVGIAIGLLGAQAMVGVDRGHADWWVASLCILTVLVRAGGHRLAAWLLALATAAIVMVAAMPGGNPLNEVALALNPAGWLAIVEMLALWIVKVQRDMDVAQRAVDESSAHSAASFGKLVLREVWLTDLRDQVDPMLSKIADPAGVLGPDDREACLALEGTLRDNIKAANLTGPALSAAIMEARLRGVQVTLVDNRGSRLPDAARRAVLRHLEGVVRDARSGKIVARTAPEGYEEAVTIVEINDHGSRMTRIDNEGMIAVSQA